MKEEMAVSTQSYCDFLRRQQGGLKHLENGQQIRQGHMSFGRLSGSVSLIQHHEGWKAEALCHILTNHEVFTVQR